MSNLQQVFTETRLEDVDLSEPQPCKYFIYMDRENPSQRLKSELGKQQYTMTLSDCSHLAHVLILWQCKNLCFTVQFLLFVILNLREISKYKPPGACIWRGDLSGGGCVSSLGALYMEGLIFGILRYLSYSWK